MLCVDKWISVAVRRNFPTRPPLEVLGCEPTCWSEDGRERTQCTTIQYCTIPYITNYNTIHYISVHNGTVQYNSVALVASLLPATREEMHLPSWLMPPLSSVKFCWLCLGWLGLGLAGPGHSFRPAHLQILLVRTLKPCPNHRIEQLHCA